MLTLVILTWPNHPTRWQYFNTCISRALREITCKDFEMHVKCVSESERDPLHNWYGDHLKLFCESRNIPLAFREGKADLGSAMNFANRASQTKYTMILQDDFYLERPIDLSEGIRTLEDNPNIDFIRYSYPAHLVSFKGSFHSWRILDEQKDWPYGDDPHLRRSTFAQKFGHYKEQERHGASESHMAHSVKVNKATILTTEEPMFGHYGNTPSVIREWRTDRPKR
jgi:hypothetical protein